MTTPRKSLRERKRAPAISVEARALFLETIAAGWSAERAAEVAGVNKRRFYERRAMDSAFAEAWQEAFDAGTEALRDELRRRALEGYTETVLDADGKVMRRTEKMNPADLHLELKRRDPSYRDGTQIAIGVPAAVVRHERGLTLADVAGFARELEEQDAGERRRRGLGAGEPVPVEVAGEVVSESVSEPAQPPSWSEELASWSVLKSESIGGEEA